MGKLVNCKTCGAEIAKNAKTCPHCGEKQKHGHPVLGALLVFFGICLLVNTISNSGSGSTVSSASKEQIDQKIEQKADTEKASKKDETMTMDEFTAIETGMSYAQVCEVVGCDGELMSEVDLETGTAKTQLYKWAGNGGVGSNANVTFQNDKVIAKAQLGLK